MGAVFRWAAGAIRSVAIPTLTVFQRLPVEQVFAVPRQLADGIPNVGQRAMGRLLGDTRRYVGGPELCEDFKRADVQIAVVKVTFEVGHLASQKASILADTVAAHRRNARLGPPSKEFQRLDLGFAVHDMAIQHTCREAALGMLAGIPCIHRVHRLGRLSDCDDRPLGQFVQMLVCDDGGYFDNRIVDRVEPGHLEIDPDQVAVLIHARSVTALAVQRSISKGILDAVFCQCDFMPNDNATVIATFSRRMRLRLDTGDNVEARIKGRRIRPVCGDRVHAEPIDAEEDWLIQAIATRDNELKRPNQRGEPEVLAANIDLIVVVAAATPKPDWFIVDRYLAAAETMRADALLIYNKADLAAPDADAISVYTAIGYTVLVTSAETGNNVEGLAPLLAGCTSIFVGQSGVGKSSLINRLIGTEQQKTAAISSKHREGRHTTVNSIMIPLPAGGNVIDSPGVRDYAPALDSSTDAAVGFREIYAASERCRFSNCRHMQEPGCEVKAGVESGAIDERRYESFRRVVIVTEKLAERRR